MVVWFQKHWKTDADWDHIRIPFDKGTAHQRVLFLLHLSHMTVAVSCTCKIESLSDAEIVERSMKRLKAVFGSELPKLVKHKVTRWGSDPHSRGCYTFLPRGACGYHYDILGQPVLGMGYGLLFAGEHTVKEHPDTVGGAFISGVRESQRVMSLLGLPPLVGRDVGLALEQVGQDPGEEETKEEPSADRIREVCMAACVFDCANLMISDCLSIGSWRNESPMEIKLQ